MTMRISASSICFGVAVLFSTVSTHAQTLSQAFQKPASTTYVFVSTAMPRSNLLTLARDSIRSKSLLVLRGGFEAKAGGLEKFQKYVLEINAQCCGTQPVSWVIDPKLFDQYQVKDAPTFVMSFGDTLNPDDFAMVSGDMELPNALKFMAQNAKSPVLRSQAATLYQTSFARE